MPETHRIEEPTPVQVQVSRTTFRVGEPIPIYLTVPVPRRELVLGDGIRLRNVRAELVRMVTLHSREDQTRAGQVYEAGPSASTSMQKSNDMSTSYALDLRQFIGTPGGGEVIALSGASCRLNPTRPIQIRLVLHSRQDDSPRNTSDLHGDTLPAPGDVTNELSTSCTSISQSTVLHDVSFSVVVHVTFMHMISHTERVYTMSIPIIILPPPAPLPQVEESLQTAYHKKHDRPPARTIRQEDSDIPQYSDGEPGPSYSAAPPPFEDPDAPPPFFHPTVASGSRLPTFQESETEIYVPHDHDESMAPPPPPHELIFDGEGVLFGFPVSEQFDGYQESDRAGTPPPSMEMATLDPDVTNLATLDESTALNALELALEQHQDAVSEDPAPPPPPAMDDPSDPPPSIDSAFRAAPLAHPNAGPVQTNPAVPELAISPGGSPEHAPPPYGVPEDHTQEHEHEHVTRPPPYVDLVPAQQGHT
jgi:neural Wiskott-Aldrich syndrome protein